MPQVPREIIADLIRGCVDLYFDNAQKIAFLGG